MTKLILWVVAASYIGNALAMWFAPHLSCDDRPPQQRPCNERIDDFADYLERNYTDEDFEALRRSEIVGRPIGSDIFLKSLEKKLSRPLRRQKRGRKKSNSVTVTVMFRNKKLRPTRHGKYGSLPRPAK